MVYKLSRGSGSALAHCRSSSTAVPVSGRLPAAAGARTGLGQDRRALLGHLAVQIARVLGANVIATASPRNHDFLHELGAAEVVDHTKDDWPNKVRALTGGGVDRMQVCAIPSVSGAAQAARDGAIIATAVPPANGQFPDADRVSWRHYTGQPSGSNLIRMAPWLDDGSLTVHIARRYFWTDAADAHREVATGHTRGKLLLLVDEDRAAQSGL
jgi:NADPH:quinone reductase-like Zn-dependent oxidoreductase